MKRFQVLQRHLDPPPSTPPPPLLPASSCAAEQNSTHVSTMLSLSDHWRLSNIESRQYYADENGRTKRIPILEAEKHEFGAKQECGIAFTKCLGQIALQPNDEDKKRQLIQKKQVVLVIGAGDATGGAVAKRFAKEGFVVCMVRRTQEKLFPLQEEIVGAGGEAHAFGVDARNEDEMVALIEHIEKSIGEINVAVYNIGANVKFGILETTSRVFFKDTDCFITYGGLGDGMLCWIFNWPRGSKVHGSTR
ncbi:hypothetical protein O6H91_15G007600 [Diphasiastrum complanatum]|uniref:Uncharacterized protein n=1 Tax=Diphasiastrum complanatum TaxID=34168 RepID=A0ACC2BGH5_DIPCM|nr:hypothetical protein O6H91_15G007600 [Diphasiastrum complanatum]